MRTSSDAVLQRHAIETFHGDEGLAMLIVDFVNGADVGMVEGGGGLGFALEAAEGLRILGDFVGQELERDEATEFDVLGLVDDSHAATAEFLDDAVVRDGLADQSGKIPDLGRPILRRLSEARQRGWCGVRGPGSPAGNRPGGSLHHAIEALERHIFLKAGNPANEGLASNLKKLKENCLLNFT